MTKPLETPFTPQDRASRILFLQRTLFQALDCLEPDQIPAWGRMTPHQMVEHLIWSFDLSTGQERSDCLVPEERRQQILPFVFNEQPNPRNFQHPSLLGGLPPLRHATLAEAIGALHGAVLLFLDRYRDDPDTLHVHPVLGPLAAEGWSRLHFKHAYHHLAQFGLIAEPGR